MKSTFQLPRWTRLSERAKSGSTTVATETSETRRDLISDSKYVLLHMRAATIKSSFPNDQKLVPVGRQICQGVRVEQSTYCISHDFVNTSVVPEDARRTGSGVWELNEVVLVLEILLASVVCQQREKRLVGAPFRNNHEEN